MYVPVAACRYVCQAADRATARAAGSGRGTVSHAVTLTLAAPVRPASELPPGSGLRSATS
jgi:hypothetical protein